jgi:hypothetical protein
MVLETVVERPPGSWPDQSIQGRLSVLTRADNFRATRKIRPRSMLSAEIPSYKGYITGLIPSWKPPRSSYFTPQVGERASEWQSQLFQKCGVARIAAQVL